MSNSINQNEDISQTILYGNQVRIDDLESALVEKFGHANNIVGVFIGKFLPLHKGHIEAIRKASEYLGSGSKLYVVITSYQEYDDKLMKAAGLRSLAMGEKYKILQRTFMDDDDIEIILFDEMKHGCVVDDWESKCDDPRITNRWRSEITRAVGEDFQVMFSSQPGYGEFNSKAFPDVIDCIIDPDRNLMPISATEIRQNPMKNWWYIAHEARPYFVKKVLVIGTPSVGKTRLVTSLARHYDTHHCKEEGAMMYRDIGGDWHSAETAKDYKLIASLTDNSITTKTKFANKLLFIDTAFAITKAFWDVYYNEQISKGKRIEDEVTPVLKSYGRDLKPDVIIFLDMTDEMAEATFVKDKVRDAYDKKGADEHKQRMLNYIEEYYSYNNPEMVIINHTLKKGERFFYRNNDIIDRINKLIPDLYNK